MRWPLRSQILFPFAGTMLIVVLGVSLLDAYLAARRTQHQIEDQLHRAAQTLVEATFPLTDAVLKQASGLSGAEFVVTDPQQHVRAASLAEMDLSPLFPLGPQTGPFRLGQPIEIASETYFHTAVGVRGRGHQLEPGVLHILYPEHFLREARWQAAYPPLAVGSALLAVVIGLAIAIARRLSRPILELRHQLSRLVQGDFQPLPVPARNDELQDLVHSANLLGDQLEELSRAIKRSERLALLGQLSGGLAHQLRNSVTGARIAVQLHQRHCGVDQESLTVALRQLAITESHLGRFLTAGQPTPPRFGACDLRQVADDAVALLAPSCHHRDVALRCDAEPCEVWADADHLRQLLLNLVLNAIEAAGAGGWVRLELAVAPRSVAIRVSDSGPGPDPRLVDRLFEPFATGKPDGIGLGLAVARRIAESHGGMIRYKNSSPTTFEVILPVDADRLLASAATAPVANTAAEAGWAPCKDPA